MHFHASVETLQGQTSPCQKSEPFVSGGEKKSSHLPLRWNKNAFEVRLRQRSGAHEFWLTLCSSWIHIRRNTLSVGFLQEQDQRNVSRSFLRYLQEKDTATHSSILAWEIPWTEEPGWATIYGVAKSQTWLKRPNNNTLLTYLGSNRLQRHMLHHLSPESHRQYQYFGFTSRAPGTMVLITNFF